MPPSNTFPVILATVCGVLTAVAVFQPELKKEQIERQGDVTFPRQTAAEQEEANTAISRAIKDDIKEAVQQVKAGGFAWGIRQAIWPAEQSKEQGNKPASETK